MKSRHVIALALGCLLLLPGIGMLIAGGGLGWASATGKDDAGYLTSAVSRLDTSTAAVTAEDLGVVTDRATPDWVMRRLDADLRVQVEHGQPFRSVRRRRPGGRGRGVPRRRVARQDHRGVRWHRRAAPNRRQLAARRPDAADLLAHIHERTHAPDAGLGRHRRPLDRRADERRRLPGRLRRRDTRWQGRLPRSPGRDTARAGCPVRRRRQPSSCSSVSAARPPAEPRARARAASERPARRTPGHRRPGPPKPTLRRPTGSRCPDDCARHQPAPRGSRDARRTDIDHLARAGRPTVEPRPAGDRCGGRLGAGRRVVDPPRPGHHRSGAHRDGRGSCAGGRRRGRAALPVGHGADPRRVRDCLRADPVGHRRPDSRRPARQHVRPDRSRRGPRDARAAQPRPHAARRLPGSDCRASPPRHR